MTDLQVKFWEALERQRANRESERQSMIDLTERERHNRATERINILMAQASQLQASAAARQAQVAELRAQLEQKRVALEEVMTSVNAAKTRAETILTQSKALSESYNQQYSAARIEESRANTDLVKARTTSEVYAQSEAESRTVLNEERAKTERITRSRELVSTINSWATMPASIVEAYGDAGLAFMRVIDPQKYLKKGS